MTSYLHTFNSAGSRSVISAPSVPNPLTSAAAFDPLMTGMPLTVNRKSVNQGLEITTSVQMGDNERKFGFSIYGGANASLYPRIDGISPDSPSARADIEIGDEVLAVNGDNLQFYTHQQIITAIHRSIQTSNVTLLLKRDWKVNLNNSSLEDSPSKFGQSSDTKLHSANGFEEVNPRPSSCNSIASSLRSRGQKEEQDSTSGCSSSHHSLILGTTATSVDAAEIWDPPSRNNSSSSNTSNFSQPNSCSNSTSDRSSSPPIPLPLPALTSWKSRDELNQLTNNDFQLTPISNPLHCDEQTDATKSSNNFLDENLQNDANLAKSQINYQRKYKKRVETGLNSFGKDNRFENLSAQSLIDDSPPATEDSTTLDFDLTSRSRNYPQTNFTHPSSQEVTDQKESDMYGQSDVDFMLSSEPVVSRQPFIDAMNAANNSYNHVPRKPRNPRQHFREMPIDVPGENIAMTNPYDRAPLPGQYNGGYNHDINNSGTDFPTTVLSNPQSRNFHHPQRYGRGGEPTPQNLSSPMMYDERHTETTSIDIESPDEGAALHETSRSNNRTTTSVAASNRIGGNPQEHISSSSSSYPYQETLDRRSQHILMKDDMQYNTDFTQLPSFISALPSQDSSTEVLQRSLSSDVFNRSLVHFEAINRCNSGGGGSQDGDDAASSTCGERLFTPASEVTLNRPSTAATADNAAQSTSPKLPTTLQVQQMIRNSDQPSETGMELYRVLDEQNIQAVLKAHEQLLHRENSRLQQKAPPLKPKPPKSGRVAAINGHDHSNGVSGEGLNGQAPLVTSLHSSTGTTNGRGEFAGGETMESSLTSDIPPEVIYKGDKRLVILQKSHHPLGATILKDGDSIRIGRIVKGGIIEASGVMKEGDEILKINEIELNRAMTVDDVCDILTSVTGRVHFLLKPGATATLNGNIPYSMQNGTHPGGGGGGANSVGETYNTRTNTATSIFDEQILHIRALFDFNPEDDEYVPCRDLGIPFDRGTVLHVMSTVDPNWWQAFPDHVIGLSANESSNGATGSLLAIQNQNTLAGLIPSKKFWRKREALRLMIEANEQSHESFNENRGNSWCCSNNRNRRHRSTRPQFGGGPYVNPSAIEVLTYEEVGLFRPEETDPRPVILVGPSKIGRHELRQRLYVRQPEYFGFAVPHTTRPAKSEEQDGVDYHFVSRRQFEAEQNNDLIVGCHELGKHMFGTSVKAIQSVMVKSKKSCVLSLHPKSIQPLRDAMVMPFVVFIAPPNLESLRNVSREIGNTLKDTELRAVIEEARVLDLQYGHLFDDVIINSNLDQCFQQLSMLCEKLRTEPQWVPVQWIGQNPSALLADDD